ncbi:MAG: HigA family addiction module antitoxin [Candidatus Acidiferrales bacterium]
MLAASAAPRPGLSSASFRTQAAALGVTRTTLSELVNGKRGISPEMAVRLSKVFGGSPESWLTQQAHYDLAHLRNTHIKLKRLQFG